MNKEIMKIIKEWKEEAGVDGIILVGVHPTFKDDITICTYKPESMIGKGGELYNKYYERLKAINLNLKHIKFVETEKYFVK